MISSHPVAIWFCILVLLVAQSTAAGKNTRQMEEERRIRALRPSFVKRDSQAPLLHAIDGKIDDEYIVKLRDDLTDDELAQFEEKFQALSEEHGLHIEFQINMTKLMKGFVARVPGDAVDILRWLDEVDFVEEDEVFHVDEEWGLDRIDQPDLPLDDLYSPYPYGDGSGVNVFVIDTGIRFTHNEFGGRAVPFTDTIGDGLNGGDCFNHGTHVAGTIGGNTVGVAPGVTLHSVRVSDCDGTGSFAALLGAMDDVAASNMLPGVVSMSMSGGVSEALNLAVQRLTAAGYVMIVSAGNDAFEACLKSPASAPEAITVGATESDDDLRASSNYGRCVNILAPGGNIRSASNAGDGSYLLMSGTSMATPHVSGVAALLLEQDNGLTQNEMLNALLNAAASNKIDLSGVPEPHRGETPNELLQIPNKQLGCSIVDGTDLRGAHVATVANVQSAETCCAHCQGNLQCTFWTWSVTGKNCYMRSSVTEAAEISWNVAGIVSRDPFDCTPIMGTDLQGATIRTVPNIQTSDQCCALCQAEGQCTNWTWSVSGKNCYIRSSVTKVADVWWNVAGYVSRE